MPDVPEFRVSIPLRCFEPDMNPLSSGRCGGHACWSRENRERFAGLYCNVHTRPGDTPIAAGALVRRVSLVIEVVFAGADWDDSTTRIEAVARLQLAVEAAGGVLNIHTATSTLGRFTPSGSLAAANASGRVGK